MQFTVLRQVGLMCFYYFPLWISGALWKCEFGRLLTKLIKSVDDQRTDLPIRERSRDQYTPITFPITALSEISPKYLLS